MDKCIWQRTALVCFLAWCGLAAAGAVGTERPNFLVISIDTLRADHLSCYGYPRKTSPFLDRFAAQATLFTDCVCSLPYTLPSHCSMLSGLHPVEHGVFANKLMVPDKVQFVQETLADEGYQTCAIVSSPILSEETNFNQGFDHFDEAGGMKDITLAEIVSNNAIDWFRQRQQDKPYFAFVHYYDVHEPYGAPGDFTNAFCVPGASEERIDAKNRAPELEREWNSSRFYESDPFLYHYTAKYDEGIAYTDFHIGRLVQTVQAMDERQNTVIIITSDHGEGLGDFKNDFRHGDTLFQSALHVPLLISIPWLDVPRRSSAPVCLEDIAVTLLDLAGVPDRPAHSQAQSLVPLFDSARQRSATKDLTRRVRFARNGGLNTPNLRISALREGMKLIHDIRMPPLVHWKIPVDAPLDAATRLRFFIKAEGVANISLQISNSNGTEETVSIGQWAGGAFASSPEHAGRNDRQSEWSMFTTGEFAQLIESERNQVAAVEHIVFELGVGPSFEGMVDDIQIEVDGQWILAESFEIHGGPLPTLKPLTPLDRGRRYQILDHRITEEGGRNSNRAPYINLRFSQYPFEKRMYDLKRDPLEQVNIEKFGSHNKQHLPLSQELDLLFERLMQESAFEARKEVSRDMKETLEALGYLD